MRNINKVIVHCSDTPASMDIGAKTIKDWHINDRNFSDIGYHFVIRRSGLIEFGRPVELSGAHAKGHNDESIGICLVGRDSFTPEQFKALKSLYNSCQNIFGLDITAHGHNEFNSHKTCPNFEVSNYIK